jgi:hypothetical protein
MRAATRLHHDLTTTYNIYHITMACPSCSFARTFATRTAAPSLRIQRAYATAPAALQQTETPSNQTEQPAQTPLLHITKSKIRHHPSNPNARPPPPHHSNVTRLLGVRFARPVVGAQEWRTSNYSYNKASVKTLPTASQITDVLLSQYVELKHTGGQPSSRAAIANRRKNSAKLYASKAGVKDFGHKVRIDAYVYDEAKAQSDARNKQAGAREARESKFNKGGAKGRRPSAPQ